ncbi:putative lyase [Rosa chinensis]|uniref:Putative lyase n=1 Tax=Rosa chinensis TaxID=74649 RepID=A0A2P6SAA2_ROSCH|nr:putative lyase [Rosa chinensis]
MFPALASDLAQTPNITATPDVTQCSANFSPSIWGDHFLSYASMEAADSKSKKHVQDLKEELKRMIMAPTKRPSQKLHFINHIQRLGVSYHFEDEIDQILQQVHREEEYDDLCTTALSFRLLRQHGYNASCNMFNKFKDGDGKFKESLVNDVVGLLSLYEASHLQMPGEDLLNEALTFSTAHLMSAAHHLSSSSQLSKQVTHALYQPLWKGMPRIEARHHLSIYQEDDAHNETLLNFAKFDFNTVQKLSSVLSVSLYGIRGHLLHRLIPSSSTFLFLQTLTMATSTSSSPPSSTFPLVQASSSSMQVQNLGPVIPVRLTETNYLLWKSVFLPVLHKYRLLSIVDGSEPCPPEKVLSSSGDLVPNDAFISWFERDQQLLIWINSTLSDSVLPYVIGYTHARDLWLNLEARFAGLSQAHLLHLKSKLQSAKKVLLLSELR